MISITIARFAHRKFEPSELLLIRFLFNVASDFSRCFFIITFLRWHSLTEHRCIVSLFFKQDFRNIDCTTKSKEVSIEKIPVCRCEVSFVERGGSCGRCFALSVTGDVQNVAMNLGGENLVREADAKF